MSASLQDLVARHLHSDGDLHFLPQRAAIQLNDTHPSIAIAELMRYGAIPVVAKVGGLADTVTDLVTGLQFHPVTREALETAIHRTADLWSDRGAWQALQANAMYSYLVDPGVPWEQHFKFARAASAYSIQHLGNEASLPTLAQINETAARFGERRQTPVELGLVPERGKRPTKPATVRR